MTTKDLEEYRSIMDFPMEELASQLSAMGFERKRLEDHELVSVATRKLKTLHAMLIATGMHKDMIAAVMSE